MTPQRNTVKFHKDVCFLCLISVTTVPVLKWIDKYHPLASYITGTRIWLLTLANDFRLPVTVVTHQCIPSLALIIELVPLKFITSVKHKKWRESNICIFDLAPRDELFKMKNIT